MGDQKGNEKGYTWMKNGKHENQMSNSKRIKESTIERNPSGYKEKKRKRKREERKKGEKKLGWVDRYKNITDISFVGKKKRQRKKIKKEKRKKKWRPMKRRQKKNYEKKETKERVEKNKIWRSGKRLKQEKESIGDERKM